jgi:Tetracyclin repressor-like, C-terminal domain
MPRAQIKDERTYQALRREGNSEEGELSAPADPDDIMALLSGPLIHRACLQGNIISDELIDRVIDSIGTWHPHS